MKANDLIHNTNTLNLDLEALKLEAGRRLRRIRLEMNGCTQAAMVAELVEKGYPSITTRTIRRWENHGIPLEKIDRIAACLGRSVHDFLPPEALEENGTKPQTNQPSATETVEETSEPPPKKRRHGFFQITLVTGILIMIMAAIWFGRGPNSSLHIDWPRRWINTTFADICGRLEGLSAEEMQKLEVRLFVHPLDGDTKYWLNSQEPATVFTDGHWYQRCRFGDEDARTMKKPPPIEFEVYAVALPKGINIPMKEGSNHIVAADEGQFKTQVAAFATLISSGFTVSRVEPSIPTPPVVLSLKPPIRPTWQEQGPMYLQIYHGGQVIRDGYFNPGQSIDLPPSTLLYQIKMSREQGFPQSSVWVMVESMSSKSS